MRGLSDYLNHVLEKIPKREERPFLNYAVGEIEKSDFTFIEAPTGYGKSAISQAIALRSLNEGRKCIIAFPLRTLLEDQFSKFMSLGLPQDIIGVRYMHHPDSRYLIKPITLTTVDTLSLTLFGIAPEDMERMVGYYYGMSRSLGHYLFSRAMVLLSDLVLDEVHLLADTTKSLNFLVALIRIFAEHGGRIVLMSATIPDALENLLNEKIGGLRFVRFSESPDKDFLEKRKEKKYDVSLEKLEQKDKFKSIVKFLEEEFLEEGRNKGGRKRYKRAIVVFNTVREAIAFRKELDQKLGELGISRDRVLLLHSRFTKGDREWLNERIRKLRNYDDYLIISTQVIEAGVDISSNFFITDLAPAASLIQRVGRFLRYSHEVKGKLVIWYEEDNQDAYKGIYDRDLIEKTLDFLFKNKINFHVPDSYKQLLNYVYDKNSFSVKEEEVNKLTSIPLALEEPKLAIDTFMELEGSFVRESSVVPVVPSRRLNSYRAIEEVREIIVPMELPSVLGIKPSEELVLSKDFRYAERRKVKIEKWYPKKVLRHVLSSGFVAFIVEASYDEELGMMIGDEQGERNGEGTELPR
ncbi:MAG: CRISPR-associated helicase Cas3' [Candidatus Korarchaeum sp.]